MDGRSLDITEEKLKRLRELFPEVFSEGKVDWEKLRASLGEDIEFSDERYVLNWAGKSDAFRALQRPTTATLVPCRQESVDFDDTENIFIEGENLEVLKVLQKSYYGKIKMIYIDPPYNTGNDFIYSDKFKEDREEYEKKAGIKDENGFIQREGLIKNTKDKGHYHSNWLSMMYPRLFLAKNLLKEDGVIFVSIDDNEVHNLRLLMNEIFGEENFVSALKWKKKKQPSYMSTHVAGIVEYILVFAKDKNSLEKLSIETRSDFNTRLDNAGNKISERHIKKGIRVKLPEDITVIKTGVYKIRTMEIEYLNDVKIKNGRTINDIKIKARFRNNQEQVNLFVEKDCFFITSNYGLRRDLLPKEKEMRKSIKDLLMDWGDNQESDTEIKSIFIEGSIFSYPKPTKLIKNLIASIFTENNIVLDFFAGSSTTAHAVLDLNKEDGGNRKFILVQLPEKCDENSEAFKAGYETIAEIGKERIRRIITQTPDPSPLTGKGEQELPGLFANPEALSKRGVFKYNPLLTERARELRKNATHAEKKLWDNLLKSRPNNFKFLRQKPIGNYILDFYCSEILLAVEVDGKIHETTKEYDKVRDEFLNECGIKVIRVLNKDVENNFDLVKKNILETISTNAALLNNIPLARGNKGVGFKVFKLCPSNFKIWRSDSIEDGETLIELMEKHIDPVKEGSEIENILYEFLLKSGVELTANLTYTSIPSPLTRKGEQQTLTPDPSPLTGNGGFYIINENEIVMILEEFNEKILKSVISKKPKKVITLDRLFKNDDQLKTNTILQMKDAGIDFKVV